jgi:hypothetical protein
VRNIPYYGIPVCGYHLATHTNSFWGIKNSGKILFETFFIYYAVGIYKIPSGSSIENILKARKITKIYFKVKVTQAKLRYGYKNPDIGKSSKK